jgi:Winged helix-turn-helix domain (DUF2582)
MIKILFAASVAFFGYVLYVLVDEQMRLARQYRDDVQNGSSGKLTQTVPEPARPRIKPIKIKVKEKTVAPIILNLADSVGTAAGSIWRYLNDKGPIAVAKLIRELPEDSKTLQRSIGWLAQEDKITLETLGRVETIALKN